MDQRIQGVASRTFVVPVIVLVILIREGREFMVLAAGIVGELVDFSERGEGGPQKQRQRQDRKCDQTNGGGTMAAAESAHERQDNTCPARTLFHTDFW